MARFGPRVVRRAPIADSPRATPPAKQPSLDRGWRHWRWWRFRAWRLQVDHHRTFGLAVVGLFEVEVTI